MFFLLAIFYQFPTYAKAVVTSKLEENMIFFLKKLTNPMLFYQGSQEKLFKALVAIEWHLNA